MQSGKCGSEASGVVSNQPELYWHDGTGGGRNIFAVFRRVLEFEAGEELIGGWIHLFADGWYRLWVNGEIFGYGPARFARRSPQFDSWKLPTLPGARTLRLEVEVHCPGTGCYQAEPGGQGGLAAWGAVQTTSRLLDLSLPEGWEVAPELSRDAEAEHFSFAQGPVELRDLRAGSAPACKPVLCPRKNPLGALVPRTLPLPRLEEVLPARIVMAAPLKDGHFRVGFRASLEAAKNGRMMFFTHIFSPRAQQVNAGVFWGPLALNGELLAQDRCLARGNRENTVLQLREGENFLVGYPEILSPCWPWLMELPAGCGLRLTALPGGDPALTFAVHEPASPLAPNAFSEDEWNPPASLEDTAGFPQGWKLLPSPERVPSPAREMAWDIPGEPMLSDAPLHWPLEIPMGAGLEGTVVFDFGDEYLGHSFFEVESAPGVVMDVGHDERLTPAGDIDFYKTNPFTNTADRFILPGGKASLEAFHERGGRYLQLTFRGGPATLHRVGVRRSTLDFPVTGNFRTSDEVFNWTWSTGVHTQQASMADGWIDPWRERGLYLGDAFVEAQVTSKFTPDRRLEIWCLRLWAATQLPNGQLPDVTPSSHEHPLNDYTLLYVWWLHNFWAWTGSLSLVRELWPTIGRIFASPIWQEDQVGLWKVTESMRLFVDWGRASKKELAGANAVLNAFRYKAHLCAGDLAAAIGREDEAQAHRQAAHRVRQIFQQALWDQEAGKFASSRIEGQLLEGPSLHANAAALACGLASPEQIPQALAYLVEGMNFTPPQVPPGVPELYFYRYILEAFYLHGKVKEAEDLVRRTFGFLRQNGCWALPETLARQHLGIGSMCHGWSASPLIFFSERILGVRPLVAGDTSQILIAPESESLDHAEGIVPHPRGDIHVAWNQQDGRLHLAAELPPGLEAKIQPRGRLAQLPLVTKITSAAKTPAPANCPNGLSAGSSSSKSALPMGRYELAASVHEQGG